MKSSAVKYGKWFVFVVFHRSGSAFRCAKVRPFAEQNRTIIHEGLAPVLAFDCPGCGKHYELADDFAGKKSRCKKCGEVFRIPVVTARVYEPGSGGPPAEPQPQWEREPVDSPVVMKSAPPLRRDYDESSLPLPPRAAYASEQPPTKRSYRHRDRGPGVGITVSKWFLIVEGGLLAPIALANYFLVLPAPVVGMVTYFYLLATALSCLVFLFWGWIWMVVIAFGEATRCGLMFLFLPFYGFYYIVTRYAEIKGAISLVGAAVAVEIAALCLSPRDSRTPFAGAPGRSAGRRRRSRLTARQRAHGRLAHPAQGQAPRPAPQPLRICRGAKRSMRDRAFPPSGGPHRQVAPPTSALRRRPRSFVTRSRAGTRPCRRGTVHGPS